MYTTRFSITLGCIVSSYSTLLQLIFCSLCDYRNVDLEKDTFLVARISAESTGETMRVKYNENHKWKYLHGMTPDEIVLIKWQVASFCSNLLVFWFEF
jgi:hypothetical protein